MINEQGHYFNRMWINHDEWRKRIIKNYIPACNRKGYDKSKIIKLDYKGNIISNTS